MQGTFRLQKDTPADTPDARVDRVITPDIEANHAPMVFSWKWARSRQDTGWMGIVRPCGPRGGGASGTQAWP